MIDSSVSTTSTWPESSGSATSAGPLTVPKTMREYLEVVKAIDDFTIQDKTVAFLAKG